MPTYEYKCDACDHAFEKFQSITAEPIKKCPACGKNKAKRQLGTGAGLIFKGSGFYITDYRSESYKSAAKSDSGNGSTSGGEGKSEKKSESKAPSAEAASSSSSSTAKGESKPAAPSSSPAPASASKKSK